MNRDCIVGFLVVAAIPDVQIGASQVVVAAVARLPNMHHLMHEHGGVRVGRHAVVPAPCVRRHIRDIAGRERIVFASTRRPRRSPSEKENKLALQVDQPPEEEKSGGLFGGTTFAFAFPTTFFQETTLPDLERDSRAAWSRQPGPRRGS